MAETAVPRKIPRIARIQGQAFRELIKEGGYTQRSLARRLGYSEGYLSQVLHGHVNAERIQREIAGLLCVETYMLFPAHKPKADGGPKQYPAPLNDVF
jgi:hypothetical protein